VLGSLFFGLTVVDRIVTIAGGFGSILLVVFLAWLLSFLVAQAADAIRRRSGIGRGKSIVLAYVGVVILVALLILGTVQVGAHDAADILARSGEVTTRIHGLLVGAQDSLGLSPSVLDLAATFDQGGHNARRASRVVMHVLILGATGRIGRLTTERALAADHAVVALVRDPARIDPAVGLLVRAGDIQDGPAVRAAVHGVDAVIAALGPRSNTLADEQALEAGMRTIVAAMEAEGVLRLVALSGAAIQVHGDRKPLIDRLASRIVRRFARHVVGAKQREYDVFAASSLEWTALRPPLVMDGEAKGYRLDLRLTPGARVTRADVAQALVDQLSHRRFLRDAPFVLPASRR
jgi:putative NADH-flavin reductase